MTRQGALIPVILAGGRGTRFWPLSRRSRPKPFLSPGGGPSLLERAWRRARALARSEEIFLAVEARLATAARSLLPELPAANLIVEPETRDTGPAAVHTAWTLERARPGATLALLPADHLVEDVDRFKEAMEVARQIATAEDALVCLGVRPTGPSTAYGYVECEGAVPGHAGRARVERFLEKPDPGRARALLDSGRCLWNAGIFVWSAAGFLREASTASTELAGPLEGLLADGDATRFFRDAPRISVDRAVLERTDRAWVVGAEMGWDDLGDWEALARHLPADTDGNVGRGQRLALDSKGCVVHSPDKPVVLVGVEDLVVVECDDVLLVARRSAAQRLREIPAMLKGRGLSDRT